MNIIQTWKTNQLPCQYVPFVNSIKQFASNWNYLFFTDNDIEAFMDSIMPEYKQIFNQFPHKIQKIDFFRYLAVYHYGGVYMDLDILLHKSLDSIIGDPNLCKFPIELKNINDTIITRNDFYSLIGNYAFYAPPKHPFIKKLIDNIASGRITMDDIKLAQSTNGDPDDQVEVYCTTGPIMVTQTYIDYENQTEILLIEPSPFKSSYFGSYGKHCSYGSWKS